MPAVTRQGDLCTGHGPCRPRPSITGSPNVSVNGIPAHRLGDGWSRHCTHTSVLGSGSRNVSVNGRPLGRVGDAVACGSLVATGSANVSAGG